MYGTIARMRVRPDRLADMDRLITGYDDLDIAGFVSVHIYRMDNDASEYYMAVLFEDRDSYRRNAEDPRQDARYRQMRELLVADPEWHDGEVVWSSAG